MTIALKQWYFVSIITCERNGFICKQKWMERYAYQSAIRFIT